MTPDERVDLLERLDRVIRENNTWDSLRALGAYVDLWEMAYGAARLAVQVSAAARAVVEQDEPEQPNDRLNRDLDALAVVGRMYLDALDADPENEMLTLPQAIRVTEVREAVERREAAWEPAEQPKAARNPRYGALGKPEPYFGSDDQREPGCPACHTILNAKAAGCDDSWHSDNRPASGGVVEPSGPLTAEDGCTLTIPPRPSDPKVAEAVNAAYGVVPAWKPGDRFSLAEVVLPGETRSPYSRRQHDPGALIEEPDLYEQGEAGDRG